MGNAEDRAFKHNKTMLIKNNKTMWKWKWLAGSQASLTKKKKAINF